MAEKQQAYEFTKKLILEVKHEGCYLGDLDTGKETGQFWDEDWDRITKGRIALRTVTKVGDYTIEMSKVKKPEDGWIKNLARSTGYLKDTQDLDEYSFSPKDVIEMRIKLLPDSLIRISLKFVGVED
jgi:hypothetical protein